MLFLSLVVFKFWYCFLNLIKQDAANFSCWSTVQYFFKVFHPAVHFLFFHRKSVTSSWSKYIFSGRILSYDRCFGLFLNRFLMHRSFFIGWQRWFCASGFSSALLWHMCDLISIPFYPEICYPKHFHCKCPNLNCSTFALFAVINLLGATTMLFV